MPVRTISAQWFQGTFAREKCRVTLQKQPAKGNLPCVHARPVGSFSAGLLLLNKSVPIFCALLQSPSMRRVWIEMLGIAVASGIMNVTLHAEGVD